LTKLTPGGALDREAKQAQVTVTAAPANNKNLFLYLSLPLFFYISSLSFSGQLNQSQNIGQKVAQSWAKIEVGFKG
jgi:hypothetical protein